MKSGIREKIFSKLNLSEDQVLDEIALLSAHQKFSEYDMEVDFFEKKYGSSFSDFDIEFQKSSASFETENDWMAWKFAIEGKNYWNNIIKEVQ